MRRPIVGVLGAGRKARVADVDCARRLGEALAREGWIVLSGGRDEGVMRAVNDGAKQVEGSLTIGILPFASSSVAPGVDVAIVTELGQGRNNVNVLTSDVVVACGDGGPGTVSEVALAIKGGKSVVLLAASPESAEFFRRLGGEQIHVAADVDLAVELIRGLLNE